MMLDEQRAFGKCVYVCGTFRVYYGIVTQNFWRSVAKDQSVPKLFFLDTVTTHKEHQSYVKHVLGSIYVPDSLQGGLDEGIGIFIE